MALGDDAMYYPAKCIITITQTRFSSCDGKGCLTFNYDGDGGSFNELFRVTFDADGSYTESQEHVSIIFDIIGDHEDYKTVPYHQVLNCWLESLSFSCTASVIDASGKKRFPQSFSLDHYFHMGDEDTFFEGFGFDKYIRRSTLLSDPHELLPDDSLTVILEIDFQFTQRYKQPAELYEYNWCTLETNSERSSRFHICLDTAFGRELCKMSTVFRDMMELSTEESSPEWIPVTEGECLTWNLLYQLLCGLKISCTLSDIYKLYNLADKYNMQRIISLCHQLLISVMRSICHRDMVKEISRDIRLISELAKRFQDDEKLRQILAIYANIENRFLNGVRVFGATNADNLETEWDCDILAFGRYFEFYDAKSDQFLMDCSFQ